MTNKARLSMLEKQAMLKNKGNQTIHVEIVGDDDEDPNYVIIDPHGKEPRRMLKSDHDAELQALEDAGEQVILIGYSNDDDPVTPDSIQDAVRVGIDFEKI